MITDTKKGESVYSMQALNMQEYKAVPAFSSSLCCRCYACVRACPAGAITVITETACSKCIKYCIIMDVPCYRDKPGFNSQSCISCGKCVETCMSQAISWNEETQTL